MITYLKGDATKPIGDGRKIIPHVVNNIGAWGAGFVLALSKRWPKTKKDYLEWTKQNTFKLGKISATTVESGDILVVHMCAQEGIGFKAGEPPIRYDALDKCLATIAELLEPGDTIHSCRFGSGLSGGSWPKIEQLIEKNLKDIPVFIYDLE